MNIVNIFVDPRNALDDIRKQPSSLMPLLLVVALTAALWLAYYARVDFDWLIDQTLSASGSLSAKQMEQARAAVSIGLMRWSSVISACVVIVAINFIGALYFFIVGRIQGARESFGAWFAFGAWTNMPMVFALIVATCQVFMMPRQTLPTDIMLTHIDPLLFHLPLSNRWQKLASSFDLINIWCFTLVALGWKQWVKQSWVVSSLVAIFPTAALYGCWALYVAFAS